MSLYFLIRLNIHALVVDTLQADLGIGKMKKGYGTFIASIIAALFFTVICCIRMNSLLPVVLLCFAFASGMKIVDII